MTDTLSTQERETLAFLNESIEGLYAKAEALTVEQQLLLIEEVLIKTQTLFAQVAALGSGEAAALGTIGHTLNSVAGHTVQALLEDHGYEASEDAEVDAIVNSVRDIMAEAALRQMPVEERAGALAFKERVEARIAAGESPMDALRAEHEVRAQAVSATVESHKEDESRYDRGVYL